ncbi:MAG: FlgD immunoglobulin-like domain containing protein, partial [Chloroflexota bacterium]
FVFQRKLVEGANLIELRAADRAGNTAVLSRQVDLVTAPPEITLVEPAASAWTNQPIVTFRGAAPAGVSVMVNNQPAQVSPEGLFETQLLLNEGENRVKVQAVDDVGNVTEVERVVYIKTRPPEISLNVGEGATVSDALLLLSGRSEAGATVQVNGRVVPVSALGDFQTSVYLVEGDNAVEVTARDQAGNTAVLSRRVRFAPGGSGALDRLWRNLASLPGFVVPVAAAALLLMALFYLRQNHVSLYLSVDQNAFTPGLPGEDRMLELALDLSQASRVTLEVLDDDGQVMATLLKNRRRSARIHLFRWDGYDDFGEPLPPGEYTIQATAGSPPVKVISAVQVTIRQDDFVHRDLNRERLRARRAALSARNRDE